MGEAKSTQGQGPPGIATPEADARAQLVELKHIKWLAGGVLVEQLVRLVEINIGKDLQFIRFNGAMVGGFAGLMLYTGQALLGLT